MLYRAEPRPERSIQPERTGWDSNPRELLDPTRFPIVLLKPLGHRSPLERRGWDSNPRTPCERHGLANRSLGPLGHLSSSHVLLQSWGGRGRTCDPRINSPVLCQLSYAPSPGREIPAPLATRRSDHRRSTAEYCPARGRTWTFLIQSQACCQLHQRAPTRIFKKSGRRGSNPRPSAWEADALPTELLPRSVDSAPP